MASRSAQKAGEDLCDLSEHTCSATQGAAPCVPGSSPPSALQGQQTASSIFAAEPEPASAPSGMSEAKRKALYSTSVFAEAPESSAAPKVSSRKT